MPFKPAVPTALSLALALAAVGGFAPATAANVTISGSGTWIHAAPNTAYSAPDATFSFSFELPQTYTPGNDAPLQGGGTTGPDIGISTDFSDFHYSLGGTPVADVPDDIAFFSVAFGGGFALAFHTISVEFYGPVDIGSSGTVSFGQYALTPYIADQSQPYSPVNQGTGPVTTSVVPEPASWALSLLGLGAAGGVLRSRRRVATSAA
jgi:hypothetical protein